MNQLIKKYARVTAIAASIVIGNTACFSGAHEAAADNLKLSSVLPTPAELRGFSRFKVSDSTSRSSLRAIATDNGKMLRVEVWKFPSETEAKKIVQQERIVNEGSGPSKGSPSGRQIGQEVWSTPAQFAEREGDFNLLTRTGAFLVRVNIMSFARGRDAKGRGIFGKITKPQLKFYEDLAIGCLNKIAKLR